MTFEPLARVVKPGDRLFLNDGLAQLIVDHVEGDDVHCKVAVGGELRSRKGLNLRAVGENPATADAAGINVSRYKYLATCIGGGIC